MDAAITTAFAQGVVNPMLCGIGGVGVLTAFSAPTGETICIRFWGTAGSLATSDLFESDVVDLRLGETPQVRGNRNSMGYEAVVVPGFVRGMDEGFQRMGSRRLSWAELLQPAIRLSAEGFTVDPYIYGFWGPEAPLADIPPAEVRLAATEACAKIYLPTGRPPAVGERLVQTDYARTLSSLAEQGPDLFYEGDIGRRIINDFASHGGLFTGDDLARYRPLTGEPLWGTFRDLSVVSDTPPGSGALVIELLNILEGLDFVGLGWNSSRYLDLLARAMRQVFADRRIYMADPRYYPVPTAQLTSKAYAGEVLRGILGAPPKTALAESPPASGQAEGTTHVSVMDRAGNAVAITHTTRDSSGVVTEGLGFMFNNDMANFDPLPRRANSIMPGKMPVTGGAPTLFLKDGRVALVIGSPAGPLKVTALVQAVLNVMLFGMTIAEAVAAERIHCEDETIFVEPSCSDQMIKELRGLGHHVIRSSRSARLAAIHVPETNRLEGGSDPRGGQGLAVVP